MRRRYCVRTRRVGSGVQPGLVTLESSQSYSLACHMKNPQLSQLPGAWPRNCRPSRYVSSTSSSACIRTSSDIINFAFRGLVMDNYYVKRMFLGNNAIISIREKI